MEILTATVEEGIPEGLTSAEVEKLTAEGKVNKTNEKVGKSYWRIISDNLFTYFNLVWAIVTALIIFTGDFTNLTFLAIVIPNLLISTVQEIRAKKTVEKLSMTTEPKASVIRDGELITINATDIVLGDVVLVEMGKQIPADAVVISGLAEANESMLTGESDAIKKETGDKVLAGSFLVSGSIYIRVIKVGKDNYIHKIEKAAKSFTAPSSNLFNDLNRLIKGIGIFLIPMAITLAVTNSLTYYNTVKDLSDMDIDHIIIKTCGSIIGMIPSGIYLLVTLTLTLSVITLSQKKTLVQDMYAIEMLASADIVCLDKTGTITDGTMHVSAVDILDKTSEEEFNSIMAAIEGSESSINNTTAALIDRFGKDVSHTVLEKIPFSSKRKYSAVSLLDLGIYSVGAPHFVNCPVTKKMEEKISAYAKEGERVLLVARHKDLGDEGTPLALIAISDRIRPGAKETIQNFQEQGVTLKVISGDNAETVSTIAGKVGINNAKKYISCESLTDSDLVLAAEKYSVFGRVTPEQKVLLVKTLKTNGHVVAMTGDGVNDTLALKESNCAIAMADGSEVARKISQIVLLNSDFGTLPDVVREGRRCINNVRQSAVLYLMKTMFTIFISILSVLTFSAFPFAPNQFLILEMFIIGLPSVLLALEPSNKRITGSFLETAIARSVPNAIAMITPVFAMSVLEKLFEGINSAARSSISMAVIIAVGFVNLLALCTPYTKWRATVVSISAALIGTAVTTSILFLGDMFSFKPIAQTKESIIMFIIMMTVGIFVAIIMQIFRGKIEKFIYSRLKRSEERKMRNNASAEIVYDMADELADEITDGLIEELNDELKN